MPKNKTDENKIPDAIRHELLDVIDTELNGCHFSQPFEVLGKWYTLRTLDPAEEAWADALVDGDTLYQTARNRRAPYVAAALVGIGRSEDKIVPVEELFKAPDDLPEIQLFLLREEEKYEAAWRRLEVLKWLADKNKHGPYVEELYSSYLEVHEKRTLALRAIDPLSETPEAEASESSDGTSSDTSLPEKEFLSPIPAFGK